jgi:hypothetical protein
MAPGLLPSPNEESRVVGEFDATLFENGINLTNRRHVSRDEVAGVLIASEYDYTVTGHFAQIDAFLNAAERFPHLCVIENLTVSNSPDEENGEMRSPEREPPERRAVLKARFLLKLYFAQGGDL